MDTETVERVTEWEAEPLTDGYDGLRSLADRSFTGAASQGRAWLFMVNGRVVGVFDGELSDFEEDDGTAYRAPDTSLALLFAMREHDGETRAQYYTEETPLSEADATLSSGNFTGYVELSENVLSGDYYVVYQAGNSTSCAFVGTEDRVLTGDEAFERADDEVGIYEVITVDLDVRDIPAADNATGEGEGADGAVDDAGDAGDSPSTGVEGQEDDQGGVTFGGGAGDSGSEARATDARTAGASNAPSESRDVDVAGDRGDDQATADRAGGQSANDTGSADHGTGSGPGTHGTETAAWDAATEAGGTTADDHGDTFAGEQQWRQASTIPALDPDETVQIDDDNDAGGTPQSDESVRERDSVKRNELRKRLGRLEQKLEKARSRRDELQSERDELREHAALLEDRVEELQSTVEQLEAELAEAREGTAAADDDAAAAETAGPDLSRAQALAGTNLFVRYRSKGQGTLEDAHDGAADRETVNQNLRLEHHTDFDADGATVDGVPFEEWLRGTVEFGFARWFVEDLVYEIRETDNVAALPELYDAIPAADRIEFAGTLEGGPESEMASFDIVVRDRMGEPLAVADFNGSQDPPAADDLHDVIEHASAVTEQEGSLSAAFQVTRNFFERDSLELAEEATGGSLLGRDKRESYVKLARNEGFHLCLVETRNGEFHVKVPEL